MHKLAVFLALVLVLVATYAYMEAVDFVLTGRRGQPPRCKNFIALR